MNRPSRQHRRQRRQPPLPYTSLNSYLLRTFGEKVERLPIDLHHPCPHRVETGGCTFCAPASYTSPYIKDTHTITTQLSQGIVHRGTPRGVTKYIAYFQSGTNTAGPVEELQQAYETAANFPGVVAVSISTRPDYLSDDICAVIHALTTCTQVWIELGVQSLHDASLQRVRRGHSAACALDAIARARECGVQHVVAHMILGLPGESHDDMIASIHGVVAAGAQGLKLHHLHVVRDTPLADEWARGHVPVMSEEEYIACVCEMLAHIPPEIVIHRLAGAAPEEMLCAPQWATPHHILVQNIQKECRHKRISQGCRLSSTLT